MANPKSEFVAEEATKISNKEICDNATKKEELSFASLAAKASAADFKITKNLLSFDSCTPKVESKYKMKLPTNFLAAFRTNHLDSDDADTEDNDTNINDNSYAVRNVVPRSNTFRRAPSKSNDNQVINLNINYICSSCNRNNQLGAMLTGCSVQGNTENNTASTIIDVLKRLGLYVAGGANNELVTNNQLVTNNDETDLTDTDFEFDEVSTSDSNDSLKTIKTMKNYEKKQKFLKRKADSETFDISAKLQKLMQEGNENQNQNEIGIPKEGKGEEEQEMGEEEEEEEEENFEENEVFHVELNEME